MSKLGGLGIRPRRIYLSLSVTLLGTSLSACDGKTTKLTLRLKGLTEKAGIIQIAMFCRTLNN